jgi:hypothetical protein
VPRKCLRVVDVETNEPKNIVNPILSATLTDELCFFLAVKKIGGCVDEFKNTLFQEVDIKT